MASLKNTATHVSKLEGKLVESTSDPLNQGVAGVKQGEMYYDTNHGSIKVKSTTSWYGYSATSTSTSSSTSTTTT